MTIGLPASGKTTWSKAKMAERPGSYKRVNKDDLRAMIDGGNWSRDNEKFILGVRDYVVAAALNAGRHVIVDDTNLAPKHRQNLAELAKKHGAPLEIVDFRHVPLDECIERDRKRPNYVGEKVIRDMHAQFIAAPVSSPPHDTALPWCVIVDIDGTLALMNGRGPFDWHRVGEDQINVPVGYVLDSIKRNEDEHIIFVSGRDECCREQTEVWLWNNCGINSPLHMRAAGDQRDDRIVKEEIYRREVKGKYNVRFILDDRDKVVRMWRGLGLTCLQVADGNF